MTTQSLAFAGIECLDKTGAPTLDAAAAMDGTLMPLGGYKGSVLALLERYATHGSPAATT